MPDTAAILPVKHVLSAKSRLSPALSEAERQLLFAALVEDTLERLANCLALAAIYVITSDERVGQLASAHGMEVAPEPDSEPSHSAAARYGAVLAAGDGFKRVAMVAADCPFADAEAFAQLVSAHEREQVALTVAVDAAGTGTNALVIEPPLAVHPAFGTGSFERHMQLGEQSGGGAVFNSEALMFDIDTPADLQRLVEDRDRAGSAVRAVLASDKFQAVSA